MRRTQIQLTKEQLEGLKRLAAMRGVSMAELIRNSVDHLLQSPPVGDPEALKTRALSAVGRFRSGVGDLAAEHDRHFAESIR